MIKKSGAVAPDFLPELKFQIIFILKNQSAAKKKSGAESDINLVVSTGRPGNDGQFRQPGQAIVGLYDHFHHALDDKITGSVDIFASGLKTGNASVADGYSGTKGEIGSLAEYFGL